MTETGPTGAPEVMAERRALTNVAYRLLGSLTDAEDAVQEAYARWYALAPEQRQAIVAPGAWLTTVVSRICLDVLGSTRVRREHYVGEWLPEPVPDPAEWGGAEAGDPADRITLDESVDMAFLVVLDAMTPAERVSFLLHDVFRYPYADIAEIVGRSPAACRQLASSARRRVRDARPVESPVSERAAVVRRFQRAWRARDVAALVELLDPSVVAIADGGGLASAAPHPVEGADRLIRFLLDLTPGLARLALVERTVNGQPGLVAERDGRTVAVYAFEVVASRITRIWVVRNPQKLRSWSATSL